MVLLESRNIQTASFHCEWIVSINTHALISSSVKKAHSIEYPLSIQKMQKNWENWDHRESTNSKMWMKGLTIGPLWQKPPTLRRVWWHMSDSRNYPSPNPITIFSSWNSEKYIASGKVNILYPVLINHSTNTLWCRAPNISRHAVVSSVVASRAAQRCCR